MAIVLKTIDVFVEVLFLKKGSNIITAFNNYLFSHLAVIMRSSCATHVKCF
jgi:hypothetical protein